MTYIPDDPFGIKLEDNPNLVGFTKFGLANGINTSSTPIDLWQAWDIDPSLNSYNFTTTATSYSIVSSSAADTQSVKVLYLIDDFQITSQTLDLSGQTKIVLLGNAIRVLRVINNDTTNFAGNIYVFEDGTTTAGVPDTKADIRAYVAAGMGNTTQQAIMTVPKGFTAFLTTIITSINKDTGASLDREAQFHIDRRKNGKAFIESIPFEAHSNAGALSIPTHPWHSASEKTDIKIRVEGVNINGSAVSGGLLYVLESKNVADVAIIKDF